MIDQTTFRPAVIRDISKLQKLCIETIREICCRDYTEKQLTAWADGLKDEQRWKDIISGQFTLVSKNCDQLTGVGTLKNGEYIDLFYIHKDHQNQGIASLLLNLLETEAKSKNSSALYSNVSITARPFFEKNGFKTLAGQTVVRNGTKLINFRMRKILIRDLNRT